MNYSTAIFLINKNARAIRAVYDVDQKAAYDKGTKYLFKTLDPNIAVGDYIIVQSGSCHGMTVVKVTEVDADVDFEKDFDMKWVIGKVDSKGFETLLGQEASAINRIKKAEMRKKRADFAEALFEDNAAEIKALPITDMNGDEDPTPPPPSYEAPF